MEIARPGAEASLARGNKAYFAGKQVRCWKKGTGIWHALWLRMGSAQRAHLMENVASMRAYLADPDKAAREERDKMMESFGEAIEGKTQAESGAAPLRSFATVTFGLSPEALAEGKERLFPPSPWRIAVGPAPL